MQTVKELMTKLPHTIGHDMDTAMAQKMMKEHHCHHLPVLDGGQLVGVISERDLRVVSSIKPNEVVENIMTDEPVIVDPETSLEETIKTLLDKNVGSVIVAPKADEPWGIFTTTDALKLLIKN